MIAVAKESALSAIFRSNPETLPGLNTTVSRLAQLGLLLRYSVGLAGDVRNPCRWVDRWKFGSTIGAQYWRRVSRLTMRNRNSRECVSGTEASFPSREFRACTIPVHPGRRTSRRMLYGGCLLYCSRTHGTCFLSKYFLILSNSNSEREVLSQTLARFDEVWEANDKHLVYMIITKL